MPAMPASLRWALGLLAGETAVLTVLVALLIYADLTATAASTSSALGITVFTAVMAALQGGLAWALYRRHGWARGPAIVLQLLFVPIGFSLASGGLPAFGLPAVVVGLAGAATLLAPPTRAALNTR